MQDVYSTFLKIMDTKLLQSLMCSKKHTHLSGTVSGDNLFIQFTTGCNGRGNSVDIRLGVVDNDVMIYLREQEPIEIKNVDDEEMIKFIENNAHKDN
jgi:hypothetical protein